MTSKTMEELHRQEFIEGLRDAVKKNGTIAFKAVQRALSELDKDTGELKRLSEEAKRERSERLRIERLAQNQAVEDANRANHAEAELTIAFVVIQLAAWWLRDCEEAFRRKGTDPDKIDSGTVLKRVAWLESNTESISPLVSRVLETLTKGKLVCDSAIVPSARPWVHSIDLRGKDWLAFKRCMDELGPMLLGAGTASPLQTIKEEADRDERTLTGP